MSADAVSADARTDGAGEEDWRRKYEELQADFAEFQQTSREFEVELEDQVAEAQKREQKLTAQLEKVRCPVAKTRASDDVCGSSIRSLCDRCCSSPCALFRRHSLIRSRAPRSRWIK